MTIFSIKNRFKYSNIRLNNVIRNKEFYDIINSASEDETIRKIYDFIHNGQYIITLQDNLIYFIKRKLYEKISHLGITFGRKYDLEEIWFNAECQLKAICLENNIDYYSSVCPLEGIAIDYNQYDKNNYYDDNGELNSNDYSFFIKRY
jgi:hypothetical protein